MVERDRDRADRARLDLAVADDRALGDAADAEDRDLRVVDDRRRQQAAELAGARDGEGRVAQLLGLERAGAGRLGETRHLVRQLVEALGLAGADDRDDEPLLGLHGDAEVVAVEVDDRVALEPGVQLGKLLQALGDRLQHGRHEALEVDVGEVALLDPGDRRHLAVRAAHVLGDEAANTAQRLAPAPRLETSPAPARRTSSSVIRPCGPLPSTDSRSTPSSCAIRLISGVARHLGRGLPRRLGRRGGLGPRLLLHHRGCGPVLADHDQHGPDGHDVAFGDQDPRDLAGRRRGDLDRRLVGLHLDQRVVLGDLLPLGDEPAGDLALGQPLAEVGQLELVGHA